MGKKQDKKQLTVKNKSEKTKSQSKPVYVEKYDNLLTRKFNYKIENVKLDKATNKALFYIYEPKDLCLFLQQVLFRIKKVSNPDRIKLDYLYAKIHNPDLLADVSTFFIRNKITYNQISKQHIIIRLDSLVSFQNIEKLKAIYGNEIPELEEKNRELEKTINAIIKYDLPHFANDNNTLDINRKLELALFSAKSLNFNTQITWYYSLLSKHTHPIDPNGSIVREQEVNFVIDQLISKKIKGFKIYDEEFIKTLPFTDQTCGALYDELEISRKVKSWNIKKILSGSKSYFSNVRNISILINATKVALEKTGGRISNRDRANLAKIIEYGVASVLKEYLRVIEDLVTKNRYVKVGFWLGKRTFIHELLGSAKIIKGLLEQLTRKTKLRNKIGFFNSAATYIEKNDIIITNAFALLSLVKFPDDDLINNEKKQEIKKALLWAKRFTVHFIDLTMIYNKINFASRKPIKVSFKHHWIRPYQTYFLIKRYNCLDTDFNEYVDATFSKYATLSPNSRRYLIENYGLDFVVSSAQCAYKTAGMAYNITKTLLFNYSILLQNWINKINDFGDLQSPVLRLLKDVIYDLLIYTEEYKSKLVGIVKDADSLGTIIKPTTKDTILDFKAKLNELLAIANRMNIATEFKKMMLKTSFKPLDHEVDFINAVINQIESFANSFTNAILCWVKAADILNETIEAMPKTEPKFLKVKRIDLTVPDYRVRYEDRISALFPTNLNDNNYRALSTTRVFGPNLEQTNAIQDFITNKIYGPIIDVPFTPEDEQNREKLFNAIWNIYIIESGISNELMRYAHKNEMKINDAYLKVAFNKSKIINLNNAIKLKPSTRTMMSKKHYYDLYEAKVELLATLLISYHLQKQAINHKEKAIYFFNRLSELFPEIASIDVINKYIKSSIRVSISNLSRLHSYYTSQSDLRVEYLVQQYNTSPYIDVRKSLKDSAKYNSFIVDKIFSDNIETENGVVRSWTLEKFNAEAKKDAELLNHYRFDPENPIIESIPLYEPEPEPEKDSIVEAIQEIKDVYETVFADDTPYTDEQLLMLRDVYTKTDEYERIVVDENPFDDDAPIAGPIKEIYDEPLFVWREYVDGDVEILEYNEFDPSQARELLLSMIDVREVNIVEFDLLDPEDLTLFDYELLDKESHFIYIDVPIFVKKFI